jgi:hypothetical protein
MKFHQVVFVLISAYRAASAARLFFFIKALLIDCKVMAALEAKDYVLVDGAELNPSKHTLGRKSDSELLQLW